MMTDFDIASHVVLAQGLSSGEDLRAWAQAALPGMPEGLPDAPLAFTKRLLMMKARRMSPGARLACEAALALEGAGEAKAWIFSSRHGETVRGVKILDAISAGEPPSPTDFMMSVHNAAAGMFTIEGRVHAPPRASPQAPKAFTWRSSRRRACSQTAWTAWPSLTSTTVSPGRFLMRSSPAPAMRSTPPPGS